MPRIINAYSQGNPLAKVISDLGNSMFGDTLTPALKQQDLQSKQREEYGINEVAKLFGAGSDIDPHRAAEFSILGGLKPDDIAMYNTYLYGNKYGPRDARTTNAMAGAGKYGDSASAFDITEGNKISMNAADNATSRANNADTLANTYRMFTEKPEAALDPSGNPVFVPQGNMTQPGYAPIPTNDLQVDPVKLVQRYITQAQALGIADPQKQRDYAMAQISKTVKKGMSFTLPDGTSFEMGGDDVSGMGGVGDLTKANETQVQKDLISAQAFDSLLDETNSKIQANPQSVGAAGNLRGGIQSARIALEDFARISGMPSVQDAWQNVQAEALAAGVKPETLNFEYDPSLSEIETLYNILAFQGVRTIGGQSGNDASDRDFKIIKQTLGDPNSWFTNARDLGAKMAVVKKYVRMRTNQNRAALRLPPLPENTAPSATGGASGETIFNWSPEGGLQ